MKTSRILSQITRLFMFAAALSAGAQSSQSYTVTLPDGFSLLANQLNNGDNVVTQVFANTPGGISVMDGNQVLYDYNLNGYYTIYAFDSEGGGEGPPTFPPPPPPPDLAPGVGFLFFNGGAPTTVTFTGTPNVPVLPASLPRGAGNYYLLGRQTNDVGTYQNITGYAPTEGAQVKSLVAAQSYDYVTNIYTGGAWTLGTPSLPVGQSAFFFIPVGSVIPFFPILGGVSFCGSGAVQFPVSGTAGYQFRVWATTNLALSPVTTTWTLVESNTFSGSPMIFTDAQATNYSQRFYTVTAP